MLKQVSPSFIELDLTDQDFEKAQKALTYTDKAAQQALQRFKHARWFIGKYGEEAFIEEQLRLKGLVTKCLLTDDCRTYSGLGPLLTQILSQPIINEVIYPEPQMVPWDNKPIYEMYYYQKAALEKLLEAKHAGVEIGTGLGKSYIILHLVKNLGLPAVVMAPSTSIAEQLYESFVFHFGSKKVGKCFGGKKEYKKFITIALPQTLTRLDPSDIIYKKLSKAPVFIADESHLCPAETLSKVCFGLMADSPYRFFFSATQLRNDGLDLLLDAITGPIVYKMTVKEGVDQGFISKPIFKMVKTITDTPCNSDDPNENTRECLLYNDRVNKLAADLANKFVTHLGHQVLILVDEVEQFTKLLPYLKHEVGFAHGPLSENKAKVPEKYWKSESTELVKRFNAGELPILIGTSCISTGTDIRTCKTLIYLMGGKSEIQIKQAVGRGTRKIQGKTECNVIDFDVVNNPTTHRHSLVRAEIYDEIYGPVETIILE